MHTFPADRAGHYRAASQLLDLYEDALFTAGQLADNSLLEAALVHAVLATADSSIAATAMARGRYRSDNDNDT